MKIGSIFYFYIKYDTHGFYDLINDVSDGQSQDVQIQNVVFNKTGNLIPTFTVYQMARYKKRQIVIESDFDYLFEN